MHIKFVIDVAWAHRGVEVKHYAAESVVDVEDEDLLRVAQEEGWATVVTPEQPTEQPPEQPTKSDGDGAAPKRKAAAVKGGSDA